jgi:transcriptional regulator of arginine metabolism
MNIHAHGGDALRRRDTILEIVRQHSVHSQEELLTFLRKRGFAVTQPTLSRDLRELGLAKTPSGYVAPGEIGLPAPTPIFASRDRREERLNQLLRDFILSAEAAGHLVVLRTPAASAQPVASAVDGAALPDVLGTVGGDDTIFVALRTADAANAFARHVRQVANLGGARRPRVVRGPRA